MAVNPKTKYAMFGALAFFLFGAVLAVIGGRLILYQYLLTERGREVLGEIIDTGSVRSSGGGYVNFIKYRFTDEAGRFQTGQSSGYSGKIGETIRITYSPAYPFIHRVTGEGRKTGYRWRWAIFGAGLFFAVAGLHWFLHTRGRIRLGRRLLQKGAVVTGVVRQITDDGRTITYRYMVGPQVYRGKTMALPANLVREYEENDRVEVLYDPGAPRRSVLKMEFV